MQRVVKPKEERGEGEGAITRVIRFASPSFLLFPWAENPKFGWLRFPRRRTEKAPAMKFEDSKLNFISFFDFFGAVDLTSSAKFSPSHFPSRFQGGDVPNL